MGVGYITVYTCVGVIFVDDVCIQGAILPRRHPRMFRMHIGPKTACVDPRLNSSIFVATHRLGEHRGFSLVMQSSESSSVRLLSLFWGLGFKGLGFVSQIGWELEPDSRKLNSKPQAPNKKPPTSYTNPVSSKLSLYAPEDELPTPLNLKLDHSLNS